VVDLRAGAVGQPGGVFGGSVAGDPGLDAAGVAFEVGLEPVEDLGDFEALLVGVEAVQLRVGEPGADLLVELLVEGGGGEGLGAQRGAALGGAVDGGVDARVLETLAQDLVLDVVQAELVVLAVGVQAGQVDELAIPDAVQERADVADAVQRVVVDDQPDRVGVVGVGPEGEALVAGPAGPRTRPRSATSTKRTRCGRKSWRITSAPGASTTRA